MERMPAQMIGARTCAANIVSFIRTNALVVCVSRVHLPDASSSCCWCRGCSGMQVVQGHSVAHLFASFFAKVLVVSLHELPLHI